MYRQGTRRQFTIDNILAISECTQVSSFSEEKKQRRKHGGVECSRLYQQINTVIPSHPIMLGQTDCQRIPISPYRPTYRQGAPGNRAW